MWKPEEGELCWFLNSCGNIIQMHWEDNGLNISRYDRGYIKKTREECEELDEYRTTRTALKRYAQKHNEGEIDWHGYVKNWTLVYDFTNKKVRILWGNVYKACGVFFTSEKIAQAAIKEIGEERIKQYLLYEG